MFDKPQLYNPHIYIYKYMYIKLKRVQNEIYIYIILKISTDKVSRYKFSHFKIIIEVAAEYTVNV